MDTLNRSQDCCGNFHNKLRSLMEQSLEEMEIPYFDGFVGANNPFFDLRALEDNLIPKHWSRLWKIHGSINWCQKHVGNQKEYIELTPTIKSHHT